MFSEIPYTLRWICPASRVKALAKLLNLHSVCSCCHFDSGLLRELAFAVTVEVNYFLALPAQSTLNQSAVEKSCTWLGYAGCRSTFED